MVRTRHFPAWVQSLVRELRSHKLHGVTKTKQKQKTDEQKSCGLVFKVLYSPTLASSPRSMAPACICDFQTTGRDPLMGRDVNLMSDD